MTTRSHLCLTEVSISAGKEWSHDAGAWTLARVLQGRGYWLGNGGPTEVEAGQGLVIPPGPCGAFRASQIGDVALEFFSWMPELLAGVLSATERQFFETQKAARALRILPAAAIPEALSRRPAGAEGALARRLRLLQCLAEVFGPDLPSAAARQSLSPSAAQRFETLMNQLTESELMDFTPSQLARRCGCSLRHFGRLFCSRFGESARTRQTTLRLQRAGLLLSSCDRKVIDVAMESGYRNLGLFNRMFKKHTGMTPSEWRHRSAQPRLFKAARLALVAAFLCVLAPLAALAASEPAAAAAPATNSPPKTGAAATNAPDRFEVNGYTVEGNTVLDPKIVKGILAPYTGPSLSFADIKKGLGELQLAYRERGFITVRVGLPQQKLTNGIVRVTVTEAKLVDVTVANNHWHSSNNVMRALPSVRTNELLNSLVFQQELNRANAASDRQIYPEVAPGPEPGTTALRLKVVDRIPIHGALELNNQALPGTPDLRFNGALRYNNLWQEDHQMGIQYSFSPEEYKAPTERLEGFIDKPLIVSYSAFYRIPMNVENPGNPKRLNSTDFGYDEINRRFRPPPSDNSVPELTLFASRSVSDTALKAQSDEINFPDSYFIKKGAGVQTENEIDYRTVTFNDDLGLRMSQPLPRIEEVESSLTWGMDYKAYRANTLQERNVNAYIWYFDPHDQRLEPHNINIGAVTSNYYTTTVNYLPLSLSWDAMRRDSWGATVLNVNNNGNIASLNSSSTDFKTVRQSHLADGNYYALNGSLTREQRIAGEWSVELKGGGQWANQPLIGNEQYGIGGTGGVRGYREGEEYGDTGWKVSIEPRAPPIDIGMVDGTLPMRLRFSAFTDYGERFLLAPQLTNPMGEFIGDGGKPRVPMWGAGAAVAGTIGSIIEFRATIAFPLLDAGGSLLPNGIETGGGVTAGTMRIYFTVSAQF